MRNLSARIVCVTAIALHLAVAYWHGVAHECLGIALNRFQRLFVDVVVVACPLLACAGLWTRLARLSLWLLIASMGSSFLFGVYFHFVAVSPDNVRFLPTGVSCSHHFLLTAALIAFLEAFIAVLRLFFQRGLTSR